MFVAWTTVASRDDAERLASHVVEQRLAVCVQIDGPVTSFYAWGGKVERADEFRLAFKCLPAALAALEKTVRERHPYTVPEWVVVRAEFVGEKYLSWARANSSSPPL